MGKIFRECIDEKYPTISHKYFKERECCEHVVCGKNIIGMVLSGSKQVENHCTVIKGDIFFMSIDNYTVRYSADEDSAYEEISVCFSVEELRIAILRFISYEEVKQNILTRNNVFLDQVVCESANINTIDIFSELKKRCSYDNEGMNEVLASVVEKIDVSKLIFSVLTDETSIIGAAIVKIIKRNNDKLRIIVSNCVGKRYTIEKISDMCNMSISQFKKLFFEIYGTSPHRWLAMQQLERSAFLLKTTDKLINEIAEECNFSNPSHLIKRFKEHYGVTPSNYRKGDR